MHRKKWLAWLALPVLLLAGFPGCRMGGKKMHLADYDPNWRLDRDAPLQASEDNSDSLAGAIVDGVFDSLLQFIADSMCGDKD